MRTKLRIITQHKLDWIVRLKTIKIFIKEPMKKWKIKKIRIKSKSIIYVNLNWVPNQKKIKLLQKNQE
jgi:hypothetical protein